MQFTLTKPAYKLMVTLALICSALACWYHLWIGNVALTALFLGSFFTSFVLKFFSGTDRYLYFLIVVLVTGGGYEFARWLNTVTQVFEKLGYGFTLLPYGIATVYPLTVAVVLFGLFLFLMEPAPEPEPEPAPETESKTE